MDGIRIAKKRRDGTLVRPCPDRSLPGHAAGDGSPRDIFLKIVRGLRRNGKILSCRHRRRLIHERFRLRIRIQYADGRTGTRRRAARETAHDVLCRERVVRMDFDIARRVDDRATSDLCERAFLSRTARRLRHKSFAKARFHFIQRCRVIGTDRFARAFVDLREFLIHPTVEADGLAILTRLARERLLVFRRHRAADVIDRDTARKSHKTDGGRDRIRHDVMHIVFRFDGHAAARCDLVSIAEEGIRLRLDISHIDGCADRRTAGAGRRGDGVLHFLDFMRRRERDILRAILAVAGLLVDLHARIRVCLRERGEVHHIRRTRKAGIRAARRLQGQIENVFAVLGIQRNLAFGIQFGRLACIGFCVFREIHHGESQPCTAARRADGCAAIAAMKFRRIRRRDGDPICISRACGSELGLVFRIRFGLRIQHIHADRAIDGRGACKAARDGRIGDICRMICCDADILPRDLRTTIDMRLRIRAHRYGRVCQPDAHCTAATDAAGTGALLEGGNRLHVRIARGDDIRRLAHMSVCRMRDKSLRSRACDTRRTADAKTCRRCRRVTGILRLYSEAFPANARVISYIGSRFLLHHFDRRGEAPGCRPAHCPAAAGRRELCRILRRHGDSARLCELGLARVRNIFVLLISDIRFRIRRNHMESGRPCAGKCIPRRDRRRNGRQVLFRLSIHADRRCLRELRTVFDGRIGMPLVRLYVCRRADARAAQVDTKAAGQAEEARCILRFDSNALISCLIVSLADRCIGLLGNDIHRDRAGTGEFRRACRKAHGDGLRRTITIAVLRRPIVRIVRLDRDAVCLDGLFFLRIAGERRLDSRVIHHDCDRRADGRIRDRARTDAKRRIAVISGIDRKGPCLHGLAAIHMGIRRRMDPVPAC